MPGMATHQSLYEFLAEWLPVWQSQSNTAQSHKSSVLDSVYVYYYKDNLGCYKCWHLHKHFSLLKMFSHLLYHLTWGRKESFCSLYTQKIKLQNLGLGPEVLLGCLQDGVGQVERSSKQREGEQKEGDQRKLCQHSGGKKKKENQSTEKTMREKETEKVKNDGK